MMSRFAFAAAMLAAFAAPAAAEVFDATTMTCQQMLDIAAKKAVTKADETNQTRLGVLLMWMQGYQAPDEHGTAVEVKSIAAGIEQVIEMCTKTPNLGLMTVTDKLIDDDAEISKDAVDLSTVTCESLGKTDDDTRAVELIWLLGYNAAVAEDSTFDLDTVGEKVTEIAAYCVKNPDMGLVTASNKAGE